MSNPAAVVVTRKQPYRQAIDADWARRRMTELQKRREVIIEAARPWREALDAERLVEQESLARQRPIRKRMQVEQKDLFDIENEISILSRVLGGHVMIADSGVGAAEEVITVIAPDGTTTTLSTGNEPPAT